MIYIMPTSRLIVPRKYCRGCIDLVIIIWPRFGQCPRCDPRLGEYPPIFQDFLRGINPLLTCTFFLLEDIVIHTFFTHYYSFANHYLRLSANIIYVSANYHGVSYFIHRSGGQQSYYSISSRINTLHSRLCIL